MFIDTCMHIYTYIFIQPINPFSLAHMHMHAYYLLKYLAPFTIYSHYLKNIYNFELINEIKA